MEASWFSNAVKNTNKTIDKATKDTAAEINRAKDRVLTEPAHAASTAPAPCSVALHELDRLGKQLEQARAAKIEASDEKDVAAAGFFTLAGALATALITMASNGLLGRFDRREKFLKALAEELRLEKDGFDFSELKRYRRLTKPSPR